MLAFPIAYTRILPCGDTSGFVRNLGIGIHIHEVQTSFRAPSTTKDSSLSLPTSSLPSVQFDVAVMEKMSLDGAVDVVKGDFGWDDVGSFLAFERHYGKDAGGNVTYGEVNAVDSSGNIIIASSARITTLGLKDMIVVSTKDNVFVAHKSQIENIRKIFR